MFHRHHSEMPESPIGPPRVRTVRLLQGDDELQAAVERAREFERRGVDAGQRRVGSYDRVLREGVGHLADVVPMDPTGGPVQERLGSDPDLAPALKEVGE
jgi:hypothetical protein